MVAIWFTLGALAPALAAAGSISGTVTDEDAHAGIAGIEVCAHPDPYTFEDICAQTGSGGAYTLDGLPASSYYVRFSANSSDLNYVDEWYDDSQTFPGDLITVGGSEAVEGIDAELEEGGVITGTVTDADTLGPAAGVWACVYGMEPTQFGLCLRTGPGGEYEVDGLPTGEYQVSFGGENEVNYLEEWYDDSETPAGATLVPVTAGTTVPGIYAAVRPGVQILGTVTEAGTGAPLNDIEVCAFDPVHSPSPEYVERCARTNAAGDYAIRSLQGDTYDIVFSQEAAFPFFDDYFFEQWWENAASVSGATPLHVTPPQTVTGIDAQLVNMIQPDPPAEGGSVPPPPGQTPPPRKCKKGFKRKLVKGKRRCVRKHQRHHRRYRHIGR